MSKHLVLAGAGHAHMAVLHKIHEIVEQGHKVSVISNDDYHYYSGMAPGMVGGTYSVDQIRFNSKSIVTSQEGVFIKDTVLRIDADKKTVLLKSGIEIGYDILSCNLGSTTQKSFSSGTACKIFSVKPIENLIKARDYILREGKERPLKVAIIGGGPSSAELAGNIVQLIKKERLKKITISVFCRSKFMGGFSAKVHKSCLSFLNQQGVTVYENRPVHNVDSGVLQTGNGKIDRADVILSAQGVRPSNVFTQSGLSTGPDGGLIVNEFLQSINHPEIFGGGDCIWFEKSPLDKVGVYAVRQNPVLLTNLVASVNDKFLKCFYPGGRYLLIFNLGCGYGVLEKGWLFVKGKAAFMIKDFIDRQFMRRFS